MSLTPSFDPESPLFPPMASYMKVDFLANQEGGVWILHDVPLPDILKWADYDADAHTLTLAYQTGKTQELGLAVPDGMTERLKKSIKINVLLVKKGQVEDVALVPINVLDSIAK